LSIADRLLTGGDPRGYSPDEIAAALDLPITVTALQRDLEGLVVHDTLVRWGIGRGALYTLSTLFTGPCAVARADEVTTDRRRGPGRGETAPGAVGNDAPTMYSV